MRDFEKKQPNGKKDEPQPSAPSKAKPRGDADLSRQHAQSQEGEPPAKAHAEILRDERFAHPANAEPLADLLGQLQHSHGNTYVQRVVSEMGETKSAAESQPRDAESHTHNTESQTRGGVQSLDAGVRSQMESAFGENFGDVRVHTSPEAERVNEELGARAVTSGRDIYFGKGEYDSSTREGKELLAHELAHVVQQRGSSSSAQANSISQVGDTFEQEADHAAASVLSGQRAHVENRSAAPALQRQHGRGPQSIFVSSTISINANTYMSDSYPDFAVNLYLSSLPGSTVDTLHVTVPAQVSASVVDLSGMNMQVHDPGGHGRRVIVIVVNRQVRGPRLIQITYSKGNWANIATYQLPPAAPAAAAAPAAPASGGRH